MTRVMKPWTLWLLTVVAIFNSPLQDPRPANGELQALAAKLRSIQVDDSFDATVPPEIRRLLSEFRNALRDGIVNGLNSDPAAPLSTAKARITADLHRQISRKVPDPSSGPYGGFVAIDLQPVGSEPDLTIATVTVSIPCGTDTALYVLMRKGNRWRALATLTSVPFRSIDGAWNDFRYGVSDLKSDGSFFVVAANVTAWCTSNWRSLRYAVHRVDARSGAKQIFSDERNIYVAANPTYSLTTHGDGFELTFLGPAPDPAVLTQEYRYQYFVTDNDVTLGAARSAGFPGKRRIQTPGITGRVFDRSGGAIPRVLVTALRESGGVPARATSGSDGTFALEGLAPGTYRVDFEVDWFDITRINRVLVRAGYTSSVNPALYPSAVPAKPAARTRQPWVEEHGHDGDRLISAGTSLTPTQIRKRPFTYAER